MAQKVITDKERKEKELSNKKEDAPFMQVDKHSDPISNFITNLKRQFRDTKGLGLGKLFGGKRVEQQKQTAEPESIIGATKTMVHSDFKNNEKSQTVQKNKKTASKTDNVIKPQQARPKNNKPKLGL
ncbi:MULTISPECIES: hypothetical protein [Chryseobacterium]|uniref:Uncharacterized protein n=1 Tax=Chryseobacterium urinae TaxID=3058400 RepID=A0ABT8U3K3_9FLAO|nr:MULTISPECIES: hypothetical protein [unclassified Chryseobacterium]MDO3424208.1 hypothetical protein [Chryseobacterium sp. APV1]